MAFDNLDTGDEEADEMQGGDFTDNVQGHPWLIVAGVIGAFVIVGLILMAIYSLIVLPQQQMSRQPGFALSSTQEVVTPSIIYQTLTVASVIYEQTSTAVHSLESQVSPTGTSLDGNRESLAPTFTPLKVHTATPDHSTTKTAEELVLTTKTSSPFPSATRTRFHLVSSTQTPTRFAVPPTYTVAATHTPTQTSARQNPVLIPATKTTLAASFTPTSTITSESVLSNTGTQTPIGNSASITFTATSQVPTPITATEVVSASFTTPTQNAKSLDPTPDRSSATLENESSELTPTISTLSEDRVKGSDTQSKPSSHRRVKALPKTGIVSEVNLPVLVGLTFILLLIIFLSRRLRTRY